MRGRNLPLSLKLLQTKTRVKLSERRQRERALCVSSEEQFRTASSLV